MNDPWEIGAAYENFMGRWSRPVADAFLGWLAAPPGCAWLDVGCGTGALCRAIVEQNFPKSVTGVDYSAGFIEHARGLYPESIFHFQEGSALALPVESGRFDWVVSGLALNFFPKPETAVAEMTRVVKAGGSVALYVWDYAGEMQMLRHFWDAATALDQTAISWDEGRRFPVCQPEPLRDLFSRAGLQAVTNAPVEITAVFLDFQDYWTPFLGKNGPAPGYVATLPPEQVAALAGHLRSRLPIQPDGKIILTLRAWAVCGKKPYD